jgi:hypothetical protein
MRKVVGTTAWQGVRMRLGEVARVIEVQVDMQHEVKRGGTRDDVMRIKMGGKDRRGAQVA